MQKYVVGFAFDSLRNHVVLIEKLRPKWQAGKLNGVGGHVEDGEALACAMSREFEEETTIKVPAQDWKYFAALTGKDYHVSCFRTFTGQVFNIQAGTDERVFLYNVRAALESPKIIHNLSYLIPLALADGTNDCTAPPVFHYGND